MTNARFGLRAQAIEFSAAHLLDVQIRPRLYENSKQAKSFSSSIGQISTFVIEIRQMWLEGLVRASSGCSWHLNQPTRHVWAYRQNCHAPTPQRKFDILAICPK